jgi:hypothetical protein
MEYEPSPLVFPLGDFPGAYSVIAFLLRYYTSDLIVKFTVM